MVPLWLRVMVCGPLIPVAILLDAVVLLYNTRFFWLVAAYVAGLCTAYYMMADESEEQSTALTVPPGRTYVFRCLEYVLGGEAVWMLIYMLKIAKRWTTRLIAVASGVHHFLEYLEAILVL